MQGLVAGVLIGLTLVAMSTPYHFAFEYWADSPLAWVIHYAVGTVTAVCVIYLFFLSQRAMISPEEPERREEEP